MKTMQFPVSYKNPEGDHNYSNHKLRSKKNPGHREKKSLETRRILVKLLINHICQKRNILHC